MGQIEVEEIAYHRNGISGEGFHVVTFIDKKATETPTRLIDKVNHQDGCIGRMVGIVFSAVGRVAVFDRAKLGDGVIGFGQNSWRGDRYETALRQAIKDADVADTSMAVGVKSALSVIANEMGRK